MPKREPPDERYLLALRDETRESYLNQDEQIDRLREQRTLQAKVPIPPEALFVSIEIRDPTIADEIQRVVATLINQPPALTVTPGKEGVESLRRNATEREHWSEEILRVAGSREPGPDTLTRLVDSVAGDGGGVTKLTFANDLWDERYALKLGGYTDDETPLSEEEESELEANKPQGRKPRTSTREDGLSSRDYLDQAEGAKKSSGPPFRWTCPDIRTVYPLFHGSDIGEVLEVTNRPINATFRKYRLGYDAQRNIVSDELAERVPPPEGTPPGVGSLVSNDSPSGSVDFIEHWDDEWCTYYVCGLNASNKATGKVVQQWRHGYGRHPYFFAPGLWMGWWRNRKVGWSVAETKRWLVEYRSYLWTIHAQQAARDTIPPVDVEVPEGAAQIRGDDGTPKTSEVYQLGKMYYGVPGTKRVPWQFPQVASSLREQIALVTESIDRLSVPRIEGNLGGIEASGFAINQVLAEARIRFDPLSKSIQKMLEDVTRFMWHLVRTKVGEKVWVYVAGRSGATGWKGMGPTDLKPDVRIAWKLDPTLPSAALIESRYHVEQVKAGFESMDQAIEQQGRNPDEVRFGIALDKMRASDWYTQYEQAYVLAEVGQGDLLEAQKEAEQAEQLAMQGSLQPPLPGPGAPGANPAVAPGGMGTPQIPDMQKMLMAQNGVGAEGVELAGATEMPGPGPGALYGAPTVPEASAAAGLVQPLR